MPFNGSGTFNRVHNWQSDAAASIPITASRVDAEDDGIASGLSNVICKDGQTSTTASIPFALGVKVGDGNVAAPTLSFSSETSSGFWRVGAGEIGLSISASQVLDIKSGSFGILSSSLSMSGNISAPAWTTSGIRYVGNSAILTDTSSTGTVTAGYTSKHNGCTIAASNSVTFTDYYGSYFADPVAGVNVALTNKWSLGADSAKINGNTTIGGVLSNSAGAAATPSITFTGDTGTGWFHKAANTIGIAAGGSEIGSVTTTGMTVTNLNVTGTLTASLGLATIATTGKYDDIVAGFKLGEHFSYGTISTAGWGASTKISEGTALGWNITSTGHYGHIGFSGDSFYIGVANNNSLNGTATTSYALQLNGTNGVLYGSNILTQGGLGIDQIGSVALQTGSGGAFTNGSNYSLAGYTGTWQCVSQVAIGGTSLFLFQKIS